MTDPTVATSEPDPLASGGHSRSYLVVRRPEGNQVIDVDDGAELVVGRSSSATVRIDDPKVSREHARILRRGGALQLVDLGSRNGTRLNGKTVRGESVPLASGDTIQVGEAEILVAETAGQRDRGDPAIAVEAELPGVVVSDPAMAQVFDRVRRVAQSETTVLLLGETGVGKEVVAEQIHRQSPRAAGPFVRLNCAVAAGDAARERAVRPRARRVHRRRQRKAGFFETADGGTLFLDEIGELPLGDAGQAAARARGAQGHARRRSRARSRVDVRVVAATNRDLEREVRRGAVPRRTSSSGSSAFIMRLPPLRERPSEIDAARGALRRASSRGA